MSYNRVLHSGAKWQGTDRSIRVSLSGYDVDGAQEARPQSTHRRLPFMYSGNTGDEAELVCVIEIRAVVTFRAWHELERAQGATRSPELFHTLIWGVIPQMWRVVLYKDGRVNFSLPTRFSQRGLEAPIEVRGG